MRLLEKVLAVGILIALILKFNLIFGRRCISLMVNAIVNHYVLSIRFFVL
jgi:hypothetical protein